MNINSIINKLDFLKTHRGIALTLIFLIILFNAITLWSEVGVTTFNVNDEILHFIATEGASTAIQQGLDPTDFWLDKIELGYPLFHHYQHLPQVIIAELNQFTSNFIPLTKLFDLSTYLLLVFFPLSIYWAMRRFGFDYLSAGIAAFIAPLLSTNGLFGIEYSSYLWLGSGLYTQLWATFFFPIALSETYRVMKNDGSLFWSVSLSAIVLLSNLIYGYMLILSTILLIFLTPKLPEIIARIKWVSLSYILTAILTAYFFIPCFIDFNYFSRGIWFDPLKYNSIGAIGVLTNLFTGNLFDYGRLSIITAFFLLALGIVITQWKSEKHRLLLVLTIFWLLAYFGQPVWGALFDILPFFKYLHFHRFIGGFHIGAVMIIGAGISLIWQYTERTLKDHKSINKNPFKIPVILGILFILILSPVLMERAQYYQYNTQWKTGSQNMVLSKSPELLDIYNTVKDLPSGRVYVGLPNDFGRTDYYLIGYVPLYSILPQMGIETFGYAYSAFQLASDVRLHFDNTKIEQYNLFNIRYVILHKSWTPASYYEKVKETGDYIIYQVPTTGYFDLVDVPAVFYGDKLNFYYPNSKWLFSPLLQQKQYPIIELGGKPENSDGLPVYSFQEIDANLLVTLTKPQAERGKINSENKSANQYQANFTAIRDCYLLLKTTYHPNWEVTLDDKPVTAVMLTPGYLGVKVSPGTHEVIFTYRPQPYRGILFFSGISLFLLVIFLKGINRKTDV